MCAISRKADRVSGASRVKLHESAEIPAGADKVWELISDWAGMLRWWLPAEAGGLKGPTLVACDLLGEPTHVPRTRRMTLSDGSVTSETIVYQNDTTRRIHYIKADDHAVSGYAATSYVDELSQAASVVHVESAFDVRVGEDPSSAAARFEAVYNAMLNGYLKYFTGPPHR